MARMGLFFATSQWDGEPYNAEPHKAAKLHWADPHLLPSNTIAYPSCGINAYLTGHPLGLHGW